MIKLDDGRIMNIVLNNVQYVPNLSPYSLFSITQAISSGWMLVNEGKTILLKNGKSVLKFNKMLKTKSGYVGGAEILPRVDDNIAASALSSGKGVDIMKFHDMLRHVSESTTKKTAEYYGVKLIGNFEVCADCAKAKARQRNVPKGNNTVNAKHNGERLFMDLSSIKTTSYGGSKFWLLVVDDKTDYSWSYFLKRKSETKDKICALVLELKTKNGLNVLFIRCDNAGENKTTLTLLLATVIDCLSSYCCISNRPVAGSIIVTHLHIESLFPFLLIVQGPIKSTQSLSHGVASASLGGSTPYFFCLLLLR
jgi:hypothetical protein